MRPRSSSTDSPWRTYEYGGYGYGYERGVALQRAGVADEAPVLFALPARTRGRGVGSWVHACVHNPCREPPGCSAVWVGPRMARSCRLPPSSSRSVSLGGSKNRGRPSQRGRRPPERTMMYRLCSRCGSWMNASDRCDAGTSGCRFLVRGSSSSLWRGQRGREHARRGSTVAVV